MSDLTIEVLKDIRDELRGLRERVDALNDRADGTNQRLDGVIEHVEALTRYTVSGFTGVHERLDGVIRIVGTHHAELETRVGRIEDHLRLR